MKEDRAKCKAAGADDYLAKPVDLDRFYSVLNKYLEPTDIDSVEFTDDSSFDEDPEFQAIVASFVNKLPTMIEDLLQAVNNTDWEKATSVAHILKGSGSSFGFPDITRIAAKLHGDLRQDQYSDASTLTEELAAVCEDIVKAA